MNAREAWARDGCGDTCTVTIECGHDGDVKGDLHKNLHEAGQALIRMDISPLGVRLRKSLACSCFNSDFIKTGKLWSLDSEGLPTFTEYTDTQTRRAIAALLGLPTSISS